MKRAVLALAGLALVAAAPDTIDQAERARQAQEDAARAASADAESAAAEQVRLAAARVAAAAALMATEQQTAALAAQITDLRNQATRAAAAAKAAADQLAPLLPLAERLASYPVETLLTVPAQPEDAVRGVLVLHTLARDIESGMARLATEQHHAADLARALETARQLQTAAAERQRDLAAALDRQIADARARQDAAEFAASDASRRAAAAAARAATLRAAIAVVTAPPSEPRHTQASASATPVAVSPGSVSPASITPAFAPSQLAAASVAVPPMTAAGGWAMPVSGHVVRDFGTSDDSGAANGATFATAAGARVVAPCGGKVAFSGLFRSYGQLLIVDCGAGLHGVLAGLGRLDVVLGQVVQVGEPVGVMGGDAASQEGGQGGGPLGSPGHASLYFEVRRNGVAVDPRQYLRPKG